MTNGAAIATVFLVIAVDAIGRHEFAYHLYSWLVTDEWQWCVAIFGADVIIRMVGSP
jgi:hypothetical protein